jgi:hypothetical protein
MLLVAALLLHSDGLMSPLWRPNGSRTGGFRVNARVALGFPLGWPHILCSSLTTTSYFQKPQPRPHFGEARVRPIYRRRIYFFSRRAGSMLRDIAAELTAVINYHGISEIYLLSIV